MATGILGSPLFLQAWVRLLGLWAARHGVPGSMKANGLLPGAALWQKLLGQYGVSHLTLGPDDNLYVANARMAQTLILHKNDVKDYLFGVEVPVTTEPEEAVVEKPKKVVLENIQPAKKVLSAAKDLIERIDENRYGIRNPSQLAPIRKDKKAKKGKSR